MFHKQHPARTDLCAPKNIYCEKSLKSNLEICIKIVSARGSNLINQFTCHTQILICRYLISYNYLQLLVFLCNIYRISSPFLPLSLSGLFTFHWLQGSIIFICHIYGIGLNSFLHFLHRLRHIYCCSFYSRSIYSTFIWHFNWQFLGMNWFSWNYFRITFWQLLHMWKFHIYFPHFTSRFDFSSRAVKPIHLTNNYFGNFADCVAKKFEILTFKLPIKFPTHTQRKV